MAAEYADKTEADICFKSQPWPACSLRALRKLTAEAHVVPQIRRVDLPLEIAIPDAASQCSSKSYFSMSPPSACFAFDVDMALPSRSICALFE